MANQSRLAVLTIVILFKTAAGNRGIEKHIIMSLGLLTIYLYLPGCSSLKGKRKRLKPLIARLHREFNISVAEVDHQDAWQNTVLAIAMVSSNQKHTQRSLQGVVDWIESYWQDVQLVDERIELI